MIKRRHILCDIDHVIANSFWRDPMIGGSWDDYHAASVDDEPLHDIVRLINTLHFSTAIIVAITARPGKWRQTTMKWLLKHQVHIDELLMRPDDDYRPAPEIKVALALKRFPDIQNEVAFIMDDREDVVAAFKALGVTALQVHGRMK